MDRTEMCMSPCTGAKVGVLSTAVSAPRGRARMLAEAGLDAPARGRVSLAFPRCGPTGSLAPPLSVPHEFRGSRTISTGVSSKCRLTRRGGLDRGRIRGRQRILRLRFRYFTGARRGRTGEVGCCNSWRWYRGWGVSRWHRRHRRHGLLLDAIVKQHTSDTGHVVPRVVVVLHTHIDVGQVSSWGCPLNGNKKGACNLLGRV